jgi:hypothetical protein
MTKQSEELELELAYPTITGSRVVKPVAELMEGTGLSRREVLDGLRVLENLNLLRVRK